MGNIYQSPPWATFQRNLGFEVFQDSGEGWSYVAVLKEGRIGRYLDCPYGPVAQSARAFDAALHALDHLARAEKCFFVRVHPHDVVLTGEAASPEEALRLRGLRRAPYDVLPVDTRIIDLSCDEETILGDMTSKNRKRYRNIHKKGVTFTVSTDPADIELLLPILDGVAERNRFVRRPDRYLREAARTLIPLGAASIFIAWFDGKAVEVTLVYDWEGTRIQAHGGTNYEYAHLDAAHVQTIRMILDAKARHFDRFDLFGTAPENAGPDHPHYGFTQFKKTFGGRPVTNPGAWDFPMQLLRYRATYALRAGSEQGTQLAKRLVR